VKFFHGDGETVGGGGLRPLRDSGAIWKKGCQHGR
jgi:hypothetical protein